MDEIKQAALAVSREYDADVIIYLGPVAYPEDRRMIERCRDHKSRPNAYVLMVTYGGNPHVAYRLGRCLQRSYSRVTVCIPGQCASAGTLFAIAANDLVMSESGLLGPLDIQLRKSDELYEMRSGLTVNEAMDTLRSESQMMFQQTLLNIKSGVTGQITLKTALETAVNLTVGAFGPLFAQIDPVRLGEDARSTRIIEEYGNRLEAKSRNLQPDALKKLVVGYPSHQFEIDREEAKESLFKSVREPGDVEARLIRALGDSAYEPLDAPAVALFSEAPEEAHSDEGKDDTADQERADSKAGKPRRGKTAVSGEHKDAPIAPATDTAPPS